MLAADPVNFGTVYAGTFYGGVKTIDGGESWTDMSQGIDGIVVESVTVDPQKSEIYATDEAARVLKTTDGGKNWTALQGLPTELPNSGPVIVDPRDSNTLYVVNGNGVWKTSDGGSELESGWGCRFCGGRRGARTKRTLHISRSLGLGSPKPGNVSCARHA